MTSKEVLACLAARYCSPEWVWAQEISLSPGFILGRRADAVAMNCYNGDPWGQAVIGFEVKVGRGDFLAELKEPKKRQETYAGCDALFLAVPKGLVNVKEVPPDMGVIECWTTSIPGGDGKLTVVYQTRIKRQPPDLDKMPVPKAMVWQEKSGYRYRQLDLDQIKPMRRSLAVSLIRAQDPDRIDQARWIRAQVLERQIEEQRHRTKSLRRHLEAARNQLRAT